MNELNVLMISSDGSAVDDGSGFSIRLRDYGAQVKSLHVLLVGRGGRQTDLELAPNVYIYDRRSRYGLKSFARSTVFAQGLVALHGVQVITAQNPFEHGWVALNAAKATGARLHIQVHTDFLSPWFTRSHIYRSPRVPMPLLNRYRLRLADRILPQADAIRAVSGRIKDSLVAKYGASIAEPSVIPIRVNPTLPEAVPLPPHAFTFALITVSRLEPEKRIEDLIMAVDRLRDGYPMLGLFIVGDGRERPRLERLVEKLGLEQKVIFMGNRSDAQGLMQSAQAYIQASAYEGYGLTLLEAALAGLPIITSDVGIVGEVFTGYENIFAAPPGDPTNLAALIAQLIEDPHARATLSMEGKRAAEAHLAAVKNGPEDIMADIARALTQRQ